MRWIFAAMILAACSITSAADIKVAIEGPAEVDSGGFALVASGPDDAVLRWRVDSPDGSQPPLRLRDTEGHPVLVFLNPAAGEYSIVLTGQVPVDGLDPFGEAVHIVVVGDAPIPPGPGPGPGPGPAPPKPDLTGIAKVVHDAAAGIDPAVVIQSAAAYKAQVAAIKAGEYSASDIEGSKAKIANAIASASPPRESAPSLFAAIEAEFAKLEEADKLTTLETVSSALSQIAKGLEAAK